MYIQDKETMKKRENECERTNKFKNKIFVRRNNVSYIYGKQKKIDTSQKKNSIDYKIIDVFLLLDGLKVM